MLKGQEKAAAIMSLLGDELSQKVLGYLPEDAAVSIISASEKLKTPTRGALLELVAEFNEYMQNPPTEPEMQEPAEPPSIAEAGTPLDIIYKSGPVALAKALEEERPEIAAYVLSHLPVERIYETVKLFKNNREAVESRLVSLKDVPVTKELENKVLKAVSERLS